jgi:drug/metabolite transporter (DMT)-like permease
MGERRRRLGVLLALHLLLMLYSTSGILSKTAARYPFMSTGFILSYGGMIAVLGVYAIGWQQVIKRIPLTTAYANRAVTVIWGIIWGAVLFHEGVSPLKVVGALVVLTGVVLFALADSEDASAADGGETRDGGADE